MLPAYAPEHLAAVKRLGQKQHPVADNEEEALEEVDAPITMYPIDYEVESKKVRNYRINDPNSVIGAIVEHTHELLTHHNIHMYYGYENVSLILGALMTLCAGANFIIKFEDFSETKWVYLYMACIFAVLFLIQRVVASLEGSNTFVMTSPASVGKKSTSKGGAKGGSGLAAVVARVLERREWIFKRCLVQLAQPEEATEGEEAHVVEQPDDGSALDTTPLAPLTAEDSAVFGDLSALFTGRATRFRIRHPVPRLPVFEVVVEILSPASVAWFKKPTVVKQVTRLYAFAHFFDEDGFIFTPRIKEEVISMLREAIKGNGGGITPTAPTATTKGGKGAKSKRA